MYLTPPSAVVAAHADSLKPGAWLLVALAFLAPFLFFFDTARAVVGVWNSSDTFAHGYIILPISLWLVWRRRANFRLIPMAPFWPGLLLLAGAGFGWMLARMGEVPVVQQYALAAMIPIIALTVFGPRLARSLAFPLLFVLFAVPFGEVFIAPLIDFTADFTVWAVQMTGIPVLRHGTRFEIPTGSWSVVEACSGVRYLISSVTLGCLYAYLTYRSTSRRLIFIALSVIVPIVANGLRAYMIVMIGHTSDMALATGVDHLIYGWVFFGIVMFILFWAGSKWREDEIAERAAPGAVAVPAISAAKLGPILLAIAAVCAVWPAAVAYNERVSRNPAPVALDMALALAPAPAFTTWKPDYLAPRASVHQAYALPGAGPVALHVLYYRNQDREHALVNSLNRLAAYRSPFNVVGSSLRTEGAGGRQLKLRESRLRGPGGNLLVWHWIWVDGSVTANDYVGKLLQARSRLLMRGDDGAAVMLVAPYGEDPAAARASLRSFLAGQRAAIDAALLAARGK